MITKNILGENISQAFIDNINSDIPDVTARFIVDGQELECVIDSVTVTKGVCGESQFSIGNVFGDLLQARVRAIDTPLKDLILEYQVGARINETDYEYISLGKFKVSEIKKTFY